MAAGEYVSVSSQSDTEKADLEREKHELETMPGRSSKSCAGFSGQARWDLALKVAQQLMAHDALGATRRAWPHRDPHRAAGAGTALPPRRRSPWAEPAASARHYCRAPADHLRNTGGIAFIPGLLGAISASAEARTEVTPRFVTFWGARHGPHCPGRTPCGDGT
jgi:hypothetical protein